MSASYFPALRVRPAAGRGFLPGEDGAPGAPPVAILGHDLWERGFGADPGLLGSALFVNGVAVTVVGIAPAGFRGITGEAQLWPPHAAAPPVYFANYFTSDQYFLGLVGRLAPGTEANSQPHCDTMAGVQNQALHSTAAGAALEPPWLKCETAAVTPREFAT